MEFKVTENLEDERILNFILYDDRATIYHHPAWLKALEKSFGYKSYYVLLLDKNENLQGLFPLVHIKNFLVGNKIISLPFSTYCDPLADYEHLDELIHFLQKNFDDNVKIDLRVKNNYSDFLTDFSKTSDYCTHILKLKDNIDDTFNSFHPTSVRASIRRAEKNKLKIVWENSERHLKIFYELEFKLRKNLMLPPIPYNFFFNVFQELSKFNLINLPVVYHEGLPVAAGFILNFKDTYYLEYTASNKNYIGLYPNHKLFFEVIKKASENRYRFVDFGRSKLDNESLIKFKKKWGTEKHPIHHFYYPPQKNANSADRRSLKKVIRRINSVLPDSILKIEGNIFYKYFL